MPSLQLTEQCHAGLAIDAIVEAGHHAEILDVQRPVDIEPLSTGVGLISLGLPHLIQP
jgi:hypothetical protein